MKPHTEAFIIPAHERQMVVESRQDRAEIKQMRAALGLCITALMFEAENAVRREDPVALSQIRDAVVAAREALK